MLAVSLSVGVLPAQAHLFERRSFWLRTEELGVARAVGLAEGVATRDQGHGLLVVHGHTGKGHAHVVPAGDRVGPAIGAFGVHIDQTHLHGGQRVFEFALAAVATAGFVPGAGVVPSRSWR